MSEEKLYIDDGELVYYINENEFIACDEIPMPMLEGIEHLQQKVEQLENENFNIRENIHLERISLPPELTKDKDFMELYDIPSYKDLQQKVEQLENENFNIRENIHLERISLPPELTKDKDFMELYDIPSYKDLQQKVEQLEKEVNEYQKELEKADSINQSCIFQGKQESKISFRKCLNRLEQLENIRKEAIEELSYMSTDAYVEDYDIREKHYNLLMNILNKGDNK